MCVICGLHPLHASVRVAMDGEMLCARFHVTRQLSIVFVGTTMDDNEVRWIAATLIQCRARIWFAKREVRARRDRVFIQQQRQQWEQRRFFQYILEAAREVCHALVSVRSQKTPLCRSFFMVDNY